MQYFYHLKKTTLLLLSALLLPSVTVAQLEFSSIKRVNLDENGAQGSIGSFDHQQSGDGRYVIFVTPDAFLPTQDLNNSSDAYLKDIQLPTGDISMVSDDQQGNDDFGDVTLLNFDIALSDDACQAVFRSLNPNLVAGDTNGNYDIFVSNCNSGQIERVNVPDGPGSQSIGDFTSSAAGVDIIRNGTDISSNGRLVTFSTIADDLSDADSDARPDIYLYQRDTGQISLISPSSDNGESFEPRFSKNATSCHILFRSSAQLMPDVTPQGFEAYAYNRCFALNPFTHVSVGTNGNSGGSIRNTFMAEDNCTVVFNSENALVSEDNNSGVDVYIRDICQNTTQLIDPIPGSATANGDVLLVDIAGSNGQYIYITSSALDSSEFFRHWYVYDRFNDQLLQVDRNEDGDQPDQGTLLQVGTQRLGSMVMLDDGSLQASFNHMATNLVSDDTNGRTDVFVTTLNAVDGPCRNFPEEDFGIFEGAQCFGTTIVNNDAELQQYLTDFDYNPFFNAVRNLEIAYSPNTSVDIRTPCSINVAGDGSNGFDINVDEFYLYGRKGIEVEPNLPAARNLINAQNITMVAEGGTIRIDGTRLISENMTCLHNTDDITYSLNRSSNSRAGSSFHMISTDSGNVNFNQSKLRAAFAEISSTGGASGGSTVIDSSFFTVIDFILEASNSNIPSALPALARLDSSGVNADHSIVIDSTGPAQIIQTGTLSAGGDMLMNAGSFDLCQVSPLVNFNIDGEVLGVCADLIQ